MIWITSLEVFILFFKKAEGNNKFEIYTDKFDDCSYAQLKNSAADILGLSDFLPEGPKLEIHGPKINNFFRKLVETGKIQTDGYYKILKGYTRSPFRNFEKNLWTLVGFKKTLNCF